MWTGVWGEFEPRGVVTAIVLRSSREMEGGKAKGRRKVGDLSKVAWLLGCFVALLLDQQTADSRQQHITHLGLKRARRQEGKKAKHDPSMRSIRAGVNSKSRGRRTVR